MEYQVFRYDTDALVALSAQAHARDIGGMCLYVMPTGSMRPTVQDYDWVVCLPPERAPFAGVQEGEILLYVADWLPAGSPPVLHRAAQKDRLGWIMSGDNNASYENKSRVTANSYRGKLVAIYRKQP